MPVFTIVIVNSFAIVNTGVCVWKSIGAGEFGLVNKGFSGVSLGKWPLKE